MNKLNLLSKLAITGAVATTFTGGSMLVAPSASAILLPPDQDSCDNQDTLADGTLNQWINQGSVLCGDKLFTFSATDIVPGANDILIFDEVTPTAYQLVYDFDPTNGDPSFFLDYEVTIQDPDLGFSAYDVDTTVFGILPNDESLEVTFTEVDNSNRQFVLESLGGDLEVIGVTPESMMIEVSNVYNSNGGGPIDDFENSFDQAPKTAPEPASILGLLVIGGLGLGLKRKKQS